MRHVGDRERRARLAARHGIVPGSRYADPVEATRAMTALHATEPATVYLSLQARCDGLTVAGVEHVLHEDRTLVKQVAMRRTLFVFPRDLLPAAWGSASARVAGQLRSRLAKEVEAAGLAEDGLAWTDRTCAAVLDLLAGVEEGLTTTAIRSALPETGGTVAVAPGTKWGGDIPLAPRLLGYLGATGAIVRGRNEGPWRVSRHHWTRTESWLGERPAALPAEEGYAELVRRWLWTCGPGTLTDLTWWLGATLGAVRAALAAVGAVEVGLDGGRTGWLLPDDLDEVGPVEPWPALLPVLDATTMGWKDRDFYLHPEHMPYLFDRNGNAGTTAWWDGRVVGCWVQDADGVVRPVLREDVGRTGREALDAEALGLTEWLDGVRVSTVYASPQMKSALLP